MAAEVKVRLAVEGAPEAIAAVRQFVDQSKRSGKEAGSAFTGAAAGAAQLVSSLKGFVGLLVAYKILEVAVATARFTAETIKLAAEQKDLALQVGTTVRNYSALAAVAKATNTEQGKLTSGLGKLSDQIDDLRRGVPEAQRAFGRLGLTAKDFASDDVVENAVKVAEALQRVARGGTQGALATDTLGKSGRALLPVFQKMNELGGLEGAAKFAEQLGVLNDARTVAIFDGLASDMQQIQQYASGLALSFARGFGPDVLLAFQQLQRFLPDLKPEFEALGKAVGVLARGFAELTVHTIGWATVLGDVLTLRFQKAREDFAKFDALLKEMRATVSDVTPVDDAVGNAGAAAAAAAAAEAAAKVRLAALAKYASAEKEALASLDRVQEVDAETRYAKGLLNLRQYYQRRIQIVQEARDRELQVLDEQIAKTAPGLELDTLNQQRDTIVNNAAATIAALGNQYEAAKGKARNFGIELQTSLTQALTNWATSGINSVRSLEDAFRSLGLTIAQALQQVAGTWLIQTISSAAGGFFGLPATGKAGGGLITGPGTGTSDSIPAWLSHGEYIVRAARVRQPGMLAHLEAINRGFSTPPLRSVLGYAGGGLVEAAGPPAAASVGGSIQIGLDDGLVLKALESPAGQRVLLKIVAKNPRAFGAAIRR